MADTINLYCIRCGKRTAYADSWALAYELAVLMRDKQKETAKIYRPNEFKSYYTLEHKE